MEALIFKLLDSVFLSLTAIIVVAFFLKISRLLFGIDLVENIKRGNMPIAIFTAALVLMIGLIIGFISLN